MSLSISKSKAPDDSFAALVSKKNVIYKVKQLMNNTIQTVYVFYGKDDVLAEKKRFTATEYTQIPELLKAVFSTQEWNEIENNQSTIIFCIH